MDSSDSTPPTGTVISESGQGPSGPSQKRRAPYQYNPKLSDEATARLVAALQNCPVVWQVDLEGRQKRMAEVAEFFSRCDEEYFGGKEGCSKRWYETQRSAFTRGQAKLELNSGAGAEDPLETLQPRELEAQELFGFMKGGYKPSSGNRFGIQWKDKKREALRLKNQKKTPSATVSKPPADEALQEIREKIGDLQREVLK